MGARATGSCPRAGIVRHARTLHFTQARAAELARVELRTMERYISGDRAMPLSVSSLLCLSLVVLGAPVALLAPWLRADVVSAMRLHA